MACTCPAAIPIVAEWDTRALTQRDCQEANVSCVSRGLHTTDCVPLEAPPLQDGHCFDNLVCSCSCRLFLVIINKQWCQCQQTSDRKRLRRLWIFPIICKFYTTCWDFAKCQDPSVPHSIRQKHAKLCKFPVRVSCTYISFHSLITSNMDLPLPIKLDRTVYMNILNRW